MELKRTITRSILWGFPCGKTIDSEWFDWVQNFMDHTRHTTSMPKPARQAGRIDIARSWLIDLAKANRQYDELVTFDADVGFHDLPCPGKCEHEVQTFDVIQSYLDADFEAGFDVIHAPVLNTHGNPSFGFSSVAGYLAISDYAPFEVDWFTGAFVAFNRRAIDTVKPVTTLTNQDGSKVRLYCRMLPEETEDADLCATLKKSGLKIGVDPRLLAGHEKSWRQYAQPGTWHLIRENAVKALAQREARA